MFSPLWLDDNYLVKEILSEREEKKKRKLTLFNLCVLCYGLLSIFAFVALPITVSNGAEHLCFCKDYFYSVFSEDYHLFISFFLYLSVTSFPVMVSNTCTISILSADAFPSVFHGSFICASFGMRIRASRWRSG